MYDTIHTLAWPWIQKLIPYPYNIVTQSLDELVRTAIQDLATLEEACDLFYKAARRAISDGLYEAAMGNLYNAYEVCRKALSKSLFVSVTYAARSGNGIFNLDSYKERWYHELCHCTTSMALACTQLGRLSVAQKYKIEALEYFDEYASRFVKRYMNGTPINYIQAGGISVRVLGEEERLKFIENCIKQNMVYEKRALQNTLNAY